MEAERKFVEVDENLLTFEGNGNILPELNDERLVASPPCISHQLCIKQDNQLQRLTEHAVSCPESNPASRLPDKEAGANSNRSSTALIGRSFFV